MDPTQLITYQLACATVLLLVLSDASIRTYLFIKLNHVGTSIASWCLAQRIGASLYVTKRSFTQDRFGRALRSYELWRVRRNPAYHEFFNRDI